MTSTFAPSWKRPVVESLHVSFQKQEKIFKLIPQRLHVQGRMFPIDFSSYANGYPSSDFDKWFEHFSTTMNGPVEPAAIAVINYKKNETLLEMIFRLRRRTSVKREESSKRRPLGKRFLLAGKLFVAESESDDSRKWLSVESESNDSNSLREFHSPGESIYRGKNQIV